MQQTNASVTIVTWTCTAPVSWAIPFKWVRPCAHVRLHLASSVQYSAGGCMQLLTTWKEQSEGCWVVSVGVRRYLIVSASLWLQKWDIYRLYPVLQLRKCFTYYSFIRLSRYFYETCGSFRVPDQLNFNLNNGDAVTCIAKPRTGKYL
jgi:hypothetical protein